MTKKKTMAIYNTLDGDELDCCKCDRFVSEVDDKGFCPSCADDERAEDFISCLGNGKTIEQCEADNDKIDEELSLSCPDFEKEAKNHPATTDCPDSECYICGWRDCPHHEPLHYHHDGCPACIEDEYNDDINDNTESEEDNSKFDEIDKSVTKSKQPYKKGGHGRTQ